jgi:hypothetical protein
MVVARLDGYPELPGRLLGGHAAGKQAEHLPLTAGQPETPAIDTDIAELVVLLNRAGIRTSQSCMTSGSEAYAKVSLKKYKPMAARNEDRNVSSGLL